MPAVHVPPTAAVLPQVAGLGCTYDATSATALSPPPCTMTARGHGRPGTRCSAQAPVVVARNQLARRFRDVHQHSSAPSRAPAQRGTRAGEQLTPGSYAGYPVDISPTGLCHFGNRVTTVEFTTVLPKISNLVAENTVHVNWGTALASVRTRSRSLRCALRWRGSHGYDHLSSARRPVQLGTREKMIVAHASVVGDTGTSRVGADRRCGTARVTAR